MSDAMKAVEVLRNYQNQLDHDGVQVGVSRQALDEVLTLVDEQAEQIKELEAERARYRSAVEDIWKPEKFFSSRGDEIAWVRRRARDALKGKGDA